ncbi:DUF4974 domain-containing protein [Chitinophaga agrisoli]|uniref:DUF4974 domain-containing protein n=1 Tax=Chitinophaga agrisoli TaxID=2607653 RepID=A0A5B2VNF7_9BACT|nr:FecR family protein [Chitinophaga agrisoli]KAA2239747.1 DUF4974 domain-containing protein [Chitinophaga agrisoli]
MQFDRELVYDLTLEEITGRISKANKEHLYQIIADYGEAFSIWQDLHDTVTPEIITRARPQHRRRNKLILAVLACIIAALSLVAWAHGQGLLPWQQQGDVYVYYPDMAVTDLLDNQRLFLKTSEGKIITFADSIATIHTKGLTLTNHNKTLRFVATDNAPARCILNVPNGMDYSIVLPDSTRVHLNAGSTLTFPTAFKGERREVMINGEAYVAAAANVLQPLFVYLPNHTYVSVIGTTSNGNAFNVNTYKPGLVEVFVEDGAVRVYADKDKEELTPGMAISAYRGRLQELFTADAAKILRWRDGIYEVPERSRVKDVLPLLQRLYGVEVKTDDASIARINYVGDLSRSTPLRNYLDSLSLQKGFQYTYQDEHTIYLHR